MDYLQYIKMAIKPKERLCDFGFKPYYKWITFNTAGEVIREYESEGVLNLIINGLPSIRMYKDSFIGVYSVYVF